MTDSSASTILEGTQGTEGTSNDSCGPLLKHAQQQETGRAGIHLIGDSSQGKTTALHVAGSIWGSPGFVRTRRATSNGLEATSNALNDALLILDEISECDPHESINHHSSHMGMVPHVSCDKD